MTKWIFISLIFFAFHSSSAQIIESNKISRDSSSRILQNKIDFFQPGGKLADALDKLSIEQNIKISYSSNRIKDYTLETRSYKQTVLSVVLDSILMRTGLSYSLIGSNIVIVEKSKNPIITKDSAQHVPLVKEPEPISEIKSDTVLSDQNKIYYEAEQDTNEPISRHHRFYISGGINYLKYLLKYKNRSEIRWKEDLNYTSSVGGTISPEIKFGILINRFSCATGISYERFRFNETVSGNILINTLRFSGNHNGPGNGQGNGNGPGKGKDDSTTVTPVTKMIEYSFSQVYNVITLPLEFQYRIIENRWMLSAGAGYELGLIFREKNLNQGLKEYYEVLKDGIYVDQSNSFASIISLKVSGGMALLPNTHVLANVEYSCPLTAFSSNSLYSFRPNSLRLGLSVSYFLNKN